MCAAFSLNTSASCESTCPVYAKAQGVCATDGNIYTDVCRAKCHDSALEVLFICKFPFNQAESTACSQRCSDQVNSNAACEKRCPVYIQAQGICASDGNIYMDECRAKCKDPSLTAEFTCSFPFTDAESKACDKKCKDLLSVTSCQNKCPQYVRYDPICASNGKIYSDLCRAKCKDPQATLLFGCNNLNLGDEECQKACTLRVSKPLCVKKCPVYGRYSRICASNGQTYLDECRAKCDDPENFQLFDCSLMPVQKCQEKCIFEAAIRKCQESCPKMGLRYTLFCATDGKLYANYCKAKCAQKSSQPLWNCEDRGYSITDPARCSKMCESESLCKRKCSYSSKNYVCAKNGVTYRSPCEANCLGVGIFEIIPRDSAEARARCRTRSLNA